MSDTVKYDTILFLDFDGTITSQETLEGSMKLCVPPELYREKEQEMREGKLTLAQTLHYAFEHIESSHLSDILDYVRSVPIRDGFQELLDGMEALQIPVVVISGGLRPYVEEKLAPFKSKLLAVHSVELISDRPTLQLVSPHEAEGDLLEKTKVMAQYSYREAICVGDGHTDVRMALASHLVFARDNLAKILTQKGVQYTSWEDFHQVLDAIQRRREPDIL